MRIFFLPSIGKFGVQQVGEANGTGAYPHREHRRWMMETG